MTLENAPTEDQITRLQGWLLHVYKSCQRYGIAVDGTDPESLQIIDLRSGSVIGIGLSSLWDNTVGVTSLDVTDSILDGAWPVIKDDGHVIEQRHLRPVRSVPQQLRKDP